MDEYREYRDQKLQEFADNKEKRLELRGGMFSLPIKTLRIKEILCSLIHYIRGIICILCPQIYFNWRKPNSIWTLYYKPHAVFALSNKIQHILCIGRLWITLTIACSLQRANKKNMFLFFRFSFLFL